MNLSSFGANKGISRDALVAAVQEALLLAAEKTVGPARQMRVEVDSKNGEIHVFARLVVAQDVVSQHDQISLTEAQRVRPNAQLGEELETEITPSGFGRVAAQYAKQALMARIRRAEEAKA